MPILLMLSVVTFAIIQAPPGDYGDYIRSMLINQGGASAEEAEAQAEAYRDANGLNDPLPIQYLNWIRGIVTRVRFRPFALLQQAGWRRGRRAPAAHHPAGADLPHPRLDHRHQRSASSPRRGNIPGSTPLLGVISFLGMTVPRFLLALIILYILVFQLNVQEIGSFFSAKYGGAPWSWDKFVDLVQHVWPVVFIATFGGLAYNMRVMRGNLLDVLNAQYVETARAKGLSEGAVIMQARRAQCAASAGRLSGRRAALHADRRDRSRHRLRPCRPSVRRSSARWRSATSMSPPPSCWCWRRR